MSKGYLLEINFCKVKLKITLCIRLLYEEIQLTFSNKVYTLFQNGRHFSIVLFSCKLALVASFLNSKFQKNIFP